MMIQLDRFYTPLDGQLMVNKPTGWALDGTEISLR